MSSFMIFFLAAALVLLSATTFAYCISPSTTNENQIDAPSVALRSKRSVRDLYDMMTDTLTIRKPHEFVGYGHYCGLPVLNRDDTPVDAIDECCQVHQKCLVNAAAEPDKDKPETGGPCYGYTSQASAGIQTFLPYRYNLTVSATNSTTITCKPYDVFTALGTNFILGALTNWTTACGLKICTCDREYTTCVVQNEAKFNQSYANMRTVVRQTVDVVPGGEEMLNKVRLGVKLLDQLLDAEAGGSSSTTAPTTIKSDKKDTAESGTAAASQLPEYDYEDGKGGKSANKTVTALLSNSTTTTDLTSKDAGETKAM